MRVKNKKKSIKYLLLKKILEFLKIEYVNVKKICVKHLWNYEKKRDKIKNRE